MIVLYTTLTVLFSVTLFLMKRRASRLERHYARLAAQANELLKTPPRKTNGKETDPFDIARRQYELGRVVQKRDRIEGRYTAWQERAEKCERLIKGLRAWKGRTLPYTFGVLDVAGVLGLLDYLGFARYANMRGLYEVVTSLFVG